MDIYKVKSKKYYLSLDGAFDELRFKGSLETFGCFPSLSDNDQVDTLWKSFGCPDCEFDLSIFRTEDLDGNTPAIDFNTIDGFLKFTKNEAGKGGGTIKIHPSHFDNMLLHLKNNSNEIEFLIFGSGAALVKNEVSSFECKIKINILKIVFDFN